MRRYAELSFYRFTPAVPGRVSAVRKQRWSVCGKPENSRSKSDYAENEFGVVPVIFLNALLNDGKSA